MENNDVSGQNKPLGPPGWAEGLLPVDGPELRHKQEVRDAPEIERIEDPEQEPKQLSKQGIDLLKYVGVLLVAIGLTMVLTPIAVLTTIVLAVKRRSTGKALVYFGKTALFAALAIDWVGNVVARDLFNLTLIKTVGYQFGQMNNGYEPETISKVVGINKHTGTLTDLGRALANLLNWLDPDHVERAAGSPAAGIN